MGAQSLLVAQHVAHRGLQPQDQATNAKWANQDEHEGQSAVGVEEQYPEEGNGEADGHGVAAIAAILDEQVWLEAREGCDQFHGPDTKGLQQGSRQSQDWQVIGAKVLDEQYGETAKSVWKDRAILG